MLKIKGLLAVAGAFLIIQAGPGAILANAVESSTTTGPPSEFQAADSQDVDPADELVINSPASIAEQFRRDTEPRESLFQIPGMDRFYEPWANLRSDLDEKHGFRPGFSFTHVYQKANEVVRQEDDAEGYEITVFGDWTFAEREDGSESTIGFEYLRRDFFGDVPPVALFTQVGSLYPTTVAFGEVDHTIGQLWFQHEFSNRIGFRAGKLFPLSAYDFFPLKNFRIDFMDAIHAANFIIPLPDRGLGGFVMYRPRPNVYLRAGFHDANADAEKSGLNSLFDEGELFKIFEIGFDPELMPRQPGRPPFGDVHLSVWHQDEREDENLSAWGFVLSGSQQFGRFLPYLRYGYTDVDDDGVLFRRVGSTLVEPTPIEHMINGGVAIDNVFGQNRDRIGIGATWSRPIDSDLDDQGALDLFYRIQVTPRIAVSPTLHVIFDPVRNPEEDRVYVWGIRSRFSF
ncbi:MAG: carbohydrate porin [Gammaproteobacteria bacterium]|nr:MAG: carbohydrate porin [Gammaproteobacteria bacterium]